MEKGIIKEVFKDYGFIYQGEEKIYFNFKDVYPNYKGNIEEGDTAEFKNGTGDNGKPRAYSVKIYKNCPKDNDCENEAQFPKYCIPSDTLKILCKNKSVINNMENMNLKLNKFAYYKEKFMIMKKDKRKVEYEISVEFKNKQLMNTIIKRQRELIEYMNYFKCIKYKPDNRAIIGLGIPSVYEVSMNLHHIYGVPHIPASSIKGITRTWVLRRYFSEKENIKGENYEWFYKIFGNNEKRAEVIFFDAFPKYGVKAITDVINPHFSEYYSGTNTAPLDTETTNPVFFLALKDASFDIYIGSKQKEEFNLKIPGFNERKTLLEATEFFIKKALDEIGLGAKTAIGYGVMSYEGEG